MFLPIEKRFCFFQNPVFPEGFFFSDIPEEIVTEFQVDLPSLAALVSKIGQKNKVLI